MVAAMLPHARECSSQVLDGASVLVEVARPNNTPEVEVSAHIRPHLGVNKYVMYGWMGLVVSMSNTQFTQSLPQKSILTHRHRRHHIYSSRLLGGSTAPCLLDLQTVNPRMIGSTMTQMLPRN